MGMRVNWATLREEMRIADVNTAILEQTQLYLKYAPIQAEAEAAKNQAKFNLERIESIVKEGLRRDLSSRGEKPTEARLNDMVSNMPDYKASVEELLTAQQEESEWKLAMQAIVMRKEMLVSISANQRMEMQTGIQRGIDDQMGLTSGLEALRARLGTQES